MQRRKAAPLGVGVTLALALALGAAAEQPQEHKERRQHRSRDILAHIDRPEPEPGWIQRHLSIHKRGGFAYTDSLALGRRRFEVTVQGPIHGKLTRQSFGLSFEIRF